MYEVPEKRVLGSRLRRLAAQGKLEKVSQLKSGVSLEKPCLNINKKAKTLPCVSFLVGFPDALLGVLCFGSSSKNRRRTCIG